MTPKQRYYQLIADTAIKHFKKRGIEAFYCEDSQGAVTKALELMPEGSSVGWGGSETLKQVGMFEALKERNYELIDRVKAKTPEEIRELKARMINADFFLMSTNAFTPDGLLVNIDGKGTRVAYLCYGPENVILFVGMNKLAPDLDSAIARAREIAAPPNNVRMETGNPCNLTGKCANCLNAATTCSMFVVTRYNRIPGRLKVILIGEELGY